ncbi:MAG: hypothetical protein AB8B56_19755 [Crocinitomicaceae bacterium]
MKLIISSILFVVLANTAYAQNWKDKLKNAKEKAQTSLESSMGVDKDYTSEYEGQEFPDMMNYLNSWEGKTLRYFIKDQNDHVLHAKGSEEVIYVKKGDEITGITIGSWNFFPKKNPDSDKIQAFSGTPGSLYMNEDNIAVYQTNGDGEVFLRYLYGPKQSINKMQTEILYYNRYTNSLIEADVEVATAERKRIAAEKAAARKAKYGLHDKKVTSISITASLPEENGNFSPYSYSIEATLEDGTKISTNDGGFFSDYNITRTGTDFSDNINGEFVEGDQVSIEASLKYNPAIKDVKKLTLDYNTNINFFMYGRGWSGSEGEDGNDVEIEIKQETHAVTGKPILRVKLTGRGEVKKFSISPNKTMIVKTYGGSGGEDDERFYNGGDGGDITVYKDPSVEAFRIKYDTNGGAPGGRSANAGRDGMYKVIEQKIYFD